MAKKSILARQEKRERLVEKYAQKRAALKKAGDYLALDKLPKNASPVRLVRRCFRCGKKRYHIRRFGACRMCFRYKASARKIPGMKKASW